MSELPRPLTVRLNTRNFSRLSHEEVLTSVEESLDILEIKAIQITENACFITVETSEAKDKLICEGLNVRGTFNNIFDVDKIVTNVTIKDAPFELSDQFLIHYMKSYGGLILWLFVRLFDLRLFCLFPSPLGVCVGLQFVVVAISRLFSYLI